VIETITRTERPRTLWRQRGFVAIFSAAAVSSFGDGVQLVALPLLGASLTSSPEVLALLAAVGIMPTLVFALPAGVIVDRLDRQSILVTVDALRATALCVLIIGCLLGGLRLWELFTVSAALGIGSAVFNTCLSSYLPAICAKDDLMVVNGRLSTVAELGNGILGPAAGGVLYAASNAIPFLINALSFVASSLAIARIPRTARSRPAAGSRRRTAFYRDALAGFHWIMARAPIRALACLVLAWNLFGWMPESTLVLYVHRDLHLGGVGYSLIFASTSVGAVAGGLVSGWLIKRIGRYRILWLSVFSYALLLVPAAFLHNAILIGGAFLLQGFPLIAWSVCSTTIRQHIVPDELRGRVGAVFALLGAGAAPVSMLAGGFLGQTIGLRHVFLVSALGIMAGAVLCAPGLKMLASESKDYWK
jgi:MFS family permease